jgi:hypothetical protein
MTNESPGPLGALFGPDFLIVTVNDDTNTKYSLEVYPDANNTLLKANGLPTQYYFVPQRIYLAKKQDSPQDFDFGMTVFKGLMTSEDTVGITDAKTPGGDVEAGGGFCTFSTTFAIPDSVIANAIKALKNKDYPSPSARLAPFLNLEAHDPDPLLGIVPILDNNVQCLVPQLSAAGTPGAPMYVNAQSATKGSLEAHGISSFLVTCNQLAAGAIAGSLKAGVSPFTVNYNLSEQFYLPACEVDVDIDMDKVYDAFSTAVSAQGFFTNASFSEAYSNCVTSGAIKTVMKIDEAVIPDDLKQMILQQSQQMQQNAINQVKSELFDWQPTDGGPATAGSPVGSLSGFFGGLFGGASVSMKSTYQKRSIHTQTSFTLDTTMAKSDTKSGDLTDLEPAIKANLDKYLAIVDIGEYFKKIQVAATSAINWNEKLPDGTSLSDPIMSAMIQVGYPDYDQPLDASGQPNLKTLAQGYHYVTGQSTGQVGLAQWNANDPNDIVNIAYLRLDQPPKQWPADQVKVRKTLVFDANDPRVDFSNNQTTIVVESTGTDHTPILTGAEVGYVFARFMCRPLPPNVTLTLTLTLGSRNDTITITKQNQQNVIWEIFSDKYFNQASFSYSVQVQVQGPDFTDNPIQYQSPQPIAVALPQGRVKYVNLVNLQLPAAPPALVSQINDYIRRYQLQPVGAS